MNELVFVAVMLGVLVVAAIVLGLPITLFVAMDRALMLPFRLLAQQRKLPFRFTLFDCGIVALKIQLALGFVLGCTQAWCSNSVVSQATMLRLGSWCVLIASWFCAAEVRLLARAGVTDPRRRALFQLVFTPLAMGAMLLLPGTALVLLVELTWMAGELMDGMTIDAFYRRSLFVTPLLAGVCGLIAFVGARFLGNRLYQAEQTSSAPPEATVHLATTTPPLPPPPSESKLAL